MQLKRRSRHKVAIVIAAVGLALMSLAACSTRVETTGTYVPAAGNASTPLPPPPNVLVYDLPVDWHSVQLDQGIRARLHRGMQGGSLSEEQQQLAAEVQSAIADTLVEQINGMRLHAMRATAATVPSPNDVMIRGQIVRVVAGNQTRRNLIGFGAGKSEIYADVQVFDAVPGAETRLLQTYNANANSGRAPGMGVGAAEAAAGRTAAAAAGGVAGAASRSRAGLPQDGERLAKRISVNLGRFFNQQGWIPESAIPSISR